MLSMQKGHLENNMRQNSPVTLVTFKRWTATGLKRPTKSNTTRWPPQELNGGKYKADSEYTIDCIVHHLGKVANTRYVLRWYVYTEADNNFDPKDNITFRIITSYQQTRHQQNAWGNKHDVRAQQITAKKRPNTNEKIKWDRKEQRWEVKKE